MSPAGKDTITVTDKNGNKITQMKINQQRASVTMNQDSKLRFSDKRQFLSETSRKLIENPYYQRTQIVR